MSSASNHDIRPKTKIVCTLGPSTESEETLLALVEAGMSVARLNLSHGNLETHSIAIQRVSDEPYEVEYQLIDLKSVAGKTRSLDSQYFMDDNNINDGFKKYLEPLVGPLPYVESLRLQSAIMNPNSGS